MMMFFALLENIQKVVDKSILQVFSEAVVVPCDSFCHCFQYCRTSREPGGPGWLNELSIWIT